LTEIAADELRHYNQWKKYSDHETQPDWPAVWKYYLLGRLLGLTFAIKLMERGEEKAQGNYSRMLGTLPEVEDLIQDENAHEQALLKLLDEERLRYAGSVVLGLNDALVELTGALAGFTLALQNVKLIALSGLITGIAAAMSMAASEYLSTRSERTDKHPARAALYTGVAYILTVTLLILPYLLIENYFIDLGLALGIALLVIAGFNYYISITNDEPFRPRFLEMAGLSFGVAAFSFVVGYFIRGWLGV
jgi:VIT1/CCC1 family predicted Fe2+/Mn2+ transporter